MENVKDYVLPAGGRIVLDFPDGPDAGSVRMNNGKAMVVDFERAGPLPVVVDLAAPGDEEYGFAPGEPAAFICDPADYDLPVAQNLDHEGAMLRILD